MGLGDIHFSQYNLVGEQQLLDKSRDFYTQAIDLGKNNSAVNFQVGKSYAMLAMMDQCNHNYSKALKEYGEAVKRYPPAYSAVQYANQAELYCYLRNREQAVNTYREADAQCGFLIDENQCTPFYQACRNIRVRLDNLLTNISACK